MFYNMLFYTYCRTHIATKTFHSTFMTSLYYRLWSIKWPISWKLYEIDLEWNKKGQKFNTETTEYNGWQLQYGISLLKVFLDAEKSMWKLQFCSYKTIFYFSNYKKDIVYDGALEENPDFPSDTPMIMTLALYNLHTSTQTMQTNVI